MKNKLKKTITEIWRIDSRGNISRISLYSLPPKKALICFRQQKEFNNFNTWDYPDDDIEIKQMRNGEYIYFVKNNESYCTKVVKLR